MWSIALQVAGWILLVCFLAGVAYLTIRVLRAVYACPHCGSRGKGAKFLRPSIGPGSSIVDDVYRCGKCGNEFEVPRMPLNQPMPFGF